MFVIKNLQQLLLKYNSITLTKKNFPDQILNLMTFLTLNFFSLIFL